MRVLNENVRLAVVISLISTAIPRMQCTSSSQSAILNSGSQPRHRTALFHTSITDFFLDKEHDHDV